jgi:Fe-S cluster assembly iron-binding protein IscA
MLAVTQEAASAIEGILASPELPDEAGVRITTEMAGAEEGAPQAELHLAVVEAPEASDQVVEDAPVFLEPEAAALLDDKVLDAEVADDQVHFNLKEQT